MREAGWKRQKEKKKQKTERRKGLSFLEPYFTTPHCVIGYFVSIFELQFPTNE